MRRGADNRAAVAPRGHGAGGPGDGGERRPEQHQDALRPRPRRAGRSAATQGPGARCAADVGARAACGRGCRRAIGAAKPRSAEASGPRCRACAAEPPSPQGRRRRPACSARHLSAEPRRRRCRVRATQRRGRRCATQTLGAEGCCCACAARPLSAEGRAAKPLSAEGRRCATQPRSVAQHRSAAGVAPRRHGGGAAVGGGGLRREDHKLPGSAGRCGRHGRRACGSIAKAMPAHAEHVAPVSASRRASVARLPPRALQPQARAGSGPRTAETTPPRRRGRLAGPAPGGAASLTTMAICAGAEAMGACCPWRAGCPSSTDSLSRRHSAMARCTASIRARVRGSLKCVRGQAPTSTMLGMGRAQTARPRGRPSSRAAPARRHQRRRLPASRCTRCAKAPRLAPRALERPRSRAGGRASPSTSAWEPSLNGLRCAAARGTSMAPSSAGRASAAARRPDANRCRAGRSAGRTRTSAGRAPSSPAAEPRRERAQPRNWAGETSNSATCAVPRTALSAWGVAYAAPLGPEVATCTTPRAAPLGISEHTTPLHAHE